MKIRPIHDQVIIKRAESENRSKGGIFIPDNAKKKLSRGEVLAVGPGKFEKGQRVPMSVMRGDVVIFGDYAGLETTHESEKYVVMPESAILAVIEPD